MTAAFAQSLSNAAPITNFSSTPNFVPVNSNIPGPLRSIGKLTLPLTPVSELNPIFDDITLYDEQEIRHYNEDYDNDNPYSQPKQIIYPSNGLDLSKLSNLNTLLSPSSTISLNTWKSLNSTQLIPFRPFANLTDTGQLLSFLNRPNAQGGQVSPQQHIANDPYLKTILSTSTSNLSFKPDYANILSRVALFDGLSPIVQNIFTLLYGSRDAFVLATPHPLEPFILAFESSMESEHTLRGLAANMGIYIPISRDFEPNEIFVDKLVEHIQFLNAYPTGEFLPGIKQFSFTANNQLPTTIQMIGMDRNQFKQLLKQFNIPFSEQVYQDRLALLRQLYLYH